MKYVIYSAGAGGFRLSEKALVRLHKAGYPFEELPKEFTAGAWPGMCSASPIEGEDYTYLPAVGALQKDGKLYIPNFFDASLRSHPALVKVFQSMEDKAAAIHCKLCTRKLENDTPYTLLVHEDGSETVRIPGEEPYVQGFVFDEE